MGTNLLGHPVCVFVNKSYLICKAKKKKNEQVETKVLYRGKGYFVRTKLCPGYLT